jgi:threonine dehydrogenase-like Zn-dependent dehydrogenase
VLVLGAGTLGLLGVLAARDLGAGEVWLTARYPHQAKLGEALGATRVLGEADATAQHLQALGREFPFDCVLETVGGEADTLQLAVEALRPGGTISVVGLFRSPISLNPFPLFMKEVTLAWSNCYDHAHAEADFATATRLLDEHRRQLLAITTHQTRLDEAARAFELAASKKTGAVKVTILI